MNKFLKRRFLPTSIVMSVILGSLFASPAKAVDFNTCNIIWFQYSGGGYGDTTGSAPGIVKDQKVFGSASNAAECQAFKDHYDSTVLESVAHTGDYFNFNIIGNYVGNKTTCSITITLNGQIWIQDQTHFEPDTYQTTPGLTTGSQNFYLPNLNESQKNLFNDLTDIGNNEFKVTTNCPGYEQANVALTSNLKIVQDSFNDFQGVSINDGAEFSNTRSVNVNLSFDSGVIGQVMISNDGGFPRSQREIINYSLNTIPWTLNATRDERMVKTIYVKYRYVDRYTGALSSTWSQTISDDIILDTTAPVMGSVTATEQPAPLQALPGLLQVNSVQSVRVNLSVKDNKSGVGKVQYSTSRNASGAVLRTYTRSFIAELPASAPRFYMRAIDKAGNWSAWRTVEITKKYSNCIALNKAYPGGVAKSTKAKNKGGKSKYKPKVSAALYKANKSKDRDKDGIACER